MALVLSCGRLGSETLYGMEIPCTAASFPPRGQAQPFVNGVVESVGVESGRI